MHYCLPYKNSTNIRHRVNLPKKLNLENSGIKRHQIPILLPIWNLPGAMLSTLNKTGVKEKENTRKKNLTRFRIIIQCHTYRSAMMSVVLPNNLSGVQLPKTSIVITRHRHEIC